MLTKEEHVQEVSWGYGYALSEDTPNRIIGNVLTTVEVAGLPEKQEQALKDMLRQRIWECFEHAIYLRPETHTDLRNRKTEADKTSQSNGNPQGVAV